MTIHTLCALLPTGAVVRLVSIDADKAPGAITQLVSHIALLKEQAITRGQFRPGLAARVEFGGLAFTVSLDAELVIDEQFIEFIPAVNPKAVAAAVHLLQ